MLPVCHSATDRYHPREFGDRVASGVSVPTNSARPLTRSRRRRRFGVTPREADVAPSLAMLRKLLRITSRCDVYGVITAAFRGSPGKGSAA